MTILLYKDGRLVVDDGNPIEGNSLEGLLACVADPKAGDTLKFNGTQWVAAGGSAYVAEFAWDSDNSQYVSVDDADDVYAQFAAGKSIVFHAPQSTLASETYIQPLGAKSASGTATFYIDSSGVGDITDCSVSNNKIILSVYIE